MGKIGRNSLCPCGSGKKFKRCHGGIGREADDIFKNNEGFIVKNHSGKNEEVYSIGSPGVKVYGLNHTQGDFKIIERNPERYIQIICVDIPTLFPLNHGEDFPVQFEGRNFKMRHLVKKRGEEYYSTLDTQQLPCFSSLEFWGNIYSEYMTNTSQAQHKGYELIVNSLHKINSFLDKDRKLHIGEDLHFSYHIWYVEQDLAGQFVPVVKTTFPYSGSIDIQSPKTIKPIDKALLKEVLAQKLLISNYCESNVVPKVEGKPFDEKVFILNHDFAFYCSQHPSSLQNLEEEHLRDLFLITAKVVFTNAEGEPFHFDGKLDYKITNPENKYEIITGEFKWWTGEKSFKDAFHQAVRKHATGQESCIYIIMLSKNKDLQKLYGKITALAESETEYISTLEKNCVPNMSKQLFRKVLINHRGRDIPLILGLIDCYYCRM